jgi:hypothetical protein
MRATSRHSTGGTSAQVRNRPRFDRRRNDDRHIHTCSEGKRHHCTDAIHRDPLLIYPDAGHGSLFQFHDSFVRQATLVLDS